MRVHGTLTSWNAPRGFGFITPAQGGQDIFVHIKSLPRNAPPPQIGQALSFEVELGPQGKKRATNVAFVQPARRPRVTDRQARAQWGTATLFVLPAFLLVLLAVFLLWRPPTWFAAVYVVISLLTFLVYAIDKGAAKAGSWRTAESTLHLLALAGGWPGALLAQQFLRHKSTKAPFRQVFWFTVFLNVAAFVLACSPLGQDFWRRGEL
jgi:uncharacterized membrane protein YsdA (DUF1294 family)/cold shock CspA family protein